MDDKTGHYDKSLADISNIINFYKEYAAKMRPDLKRKQIEDVSEDISIAEWKKSLRYSEYEAALLFNKLLDEFDIPEQEDLKK
jgi:hypothetical protein